MRRHWPTDFETIIVYERHWPTDFETIIVYERHWPLTSKLLLCMRDTGH